MAQSYIRGDEPIPGYRLVKFLGRGAFGEVWEATGPGGIGCALKIINLVDKQGFKESRTIRLLKRIHHPNLIPIIAFWLKDEQGNILENAGEADSVWLTGKEAELFVAMGLGEKNLANRLNECFEQGKPGIPTEELLDYMEEAAKGIDFLNQPRHDLGFGPVSIQHCDIKPQNILIVGGSAQVCDFGLARQLNDVRKTSTAAGTYAYIAPESIDNLPSKTIDQYSLAISYVELRTGSLPFNVTSLYEVMFVHLEGKLDFSKLSETEQIVLKRATARNPNDRFPSCTEMVKALRRAMEGKPTSKPDFSGPPRARWRGVVGEADHQADRLAPPVGLLQPDIEIVPGYKLVRFIGRGGYGEAWEAKAAGDKLVALKIIRNLEAAGGQQEYKALELIKAVDHNHLMELHAYWLLDSNGQIIPDELRKQADAPIASTLVLATKLANKNLLERLEECRQSQGGGGGIPLPELLVYMRQAADAIDYLNAPHHTLGDRQVSILHRDIKPENILLSANSVKVTDFGLAQVVEGTSAIIHAGLTFSYAAPEVFANTVTSWSDQYSLAVTYFHLRTGSLPFHATAPTEIFVIHFDGRLDLDALPEPERKVIARATAIEPQGRFPTCTEMVRALEEACGVSTAPSIVVGGHPRSGPSLPGNPYITLTESLQPGNLVLAELKQDTDPARRDTDRPLPGTPPGSEPTIDYGSGPPPEEEAPAEVKVTLPHGWKKTAETRPSEPRGASLLSRTKMADLVHAIKLAAVLLTILIAGTLSLKGLEEFSAYVVATVLLLLILVIFVGFKRREKISTIFPDFRKSVKPVPDPSGRRPDAAQSHKDGSIADNVEPAEAPPYVARPNPAFVEAESPYIVGRPVQGELFVGRGDILKMVQANLTPGAAKNILVLRGQRRTGKTSVLLRLRETLARDCDGLYLPVFVDVQGMTMVENDSQFFHLLAHQIWSELRTHDVNVPKPLGPEFQQGPLIAFELGFLEKLKTSLGQRQILLMLDEFEMLKGLIDRGSVSDKVLDYCRHLMQHSPLLFLIAGTQKLRELTGGYWSVFFNLAVAIDIGTLTETETRWLITEPVRRWYTVEPEAVQQIVQLAGCHPYFTQLVCTKLLEVRNELRLQSVGLVHVQEAVNRALQSGDEQIGYPWTEEDCTSAERLVLAMLAEECDYTISVSTTALRRRLEDAGLAVAVNEAAHRLRLRGVLRADNEERLTFVVPLFQRWLARKNYHSIEAARQYNQEHLRVVGATDA